MLKTVTFLSATAAATDYYYSGNIGQSATASGAIAFKISYTAQENYTFTTYHDFQFMMEEKFTGATGEMAEMFSCLWPSECTLHRVTPNSDLTEYIVDTEIYTEPASVSKPISGWYID